MTHSLKCHIFLPYLAYTHCMTRSLGTWFPTNITYATVTLNTFIITSYIYLLMILNKNSWYANMLLYHNSQIHDKWTLSLGNIYPNKHAKVITSNLHYCTPILFFNQRYLKVKILVCASFNTNIFTIRNEPYHTLARTHLNTYTRGRAHTHT